MADDNYLWSTLFAFKDQEKKFLKKISAGTGDLQNIQDVIKEMGDKSHHDEGRDVNNGKAEHAEKKPIGQEKFEGDGTVLDFIKKIDPSNSSGAVQPAVDIMKKLLNNTDPLKAVQGMMGGDLYGIMNQVMGLINQAGSKGNGSNGGVSVKSPCSLVDPVTKQDVLGTLQYNKDGVLTCVKNKADGSPGQVTI